MFSKRTIRQHTEIISVDTASEALAVSMGEKAKVDMPYMMQLTGKTEEEIFADLSGRYFRIRFMRRTAVRRNTLPQMSTFGQCVRENWRRLKYLAESDPVFRVYRDGFGRSSADGSDCKRDLFVLSNMASKDVVQKSCMSCWTPYYAVEGSALFPLHRRWNVEGASPRSRKINATSTYGTDRVNAYKIIEETLNLRDVRVFDYVEDEQTSSCPEQEGNCNRASRSWTSRRLQDWIWTDQPRRADCASSGE